MRWAVPHIGFSLTVERKCPMTIENPSKKIALFSHSAHFGGAETALLNLVKLIKAAGHEPIVFLPKVRTGELIDPLRGLGVSIDFFDRL